MCHDTWISSTACDSNLDLPPSDAKKLFSKMPNEHFCLKWNNYQTNIVAALGNLKLDEEFVDVTLSCEGKSIKAHKVILSACSDYFREVFRVSD